MNSGVAEDGRAAVSSCNKLDGTQVTVVGHVIESMPACCDVITDEQVSERIYLPHPSSR